MIISGLHSHACRGSSSVFNFYGCSHGRSDASASRAAQTWKLPIAPLRTCLCPCSGVCSLQTRVVHFPSFSFSPAISDLDIARCTPTRLLPDTSRAPRTRARITHHGQSLPRLPITFSSLGSLALRVAVSVKQMRNLTSHGTRSSPPFPAHFTRHGPIRRPAHDASNRRGRSSIFAPSCTAL